MRVVHERRTRRKLSDQAPRRESISERRPVQHGRELATLHAGDAASHLRIAEAAVRSTALISAESGNLAVGALNKRSWGEILEGQRNAQK